MGSGFLGHECNSGRRRSSRMLPQACGFAAARARPRLAPPLLLRSMSRPSSSRFGVKTRSGANVVRFPRQAHGAGPPASLKIRPTTVAVIGSSPAMGSWETPVNMNCEGTVHFLILSSSQTLAAHQGTWVWGPRQPSVVRKACVCSGRFGVSSSSSSP